MQLYQQDILRLLVEELAMRLAWVVGLGTALAWLVLGVIRLACVVGLGAVLAWLILGVTRPASPPSSVPHSSTPAATGKSKTINRAAEPSAVIDAFSRLLADDANRSAGGHPSHDVVTGTAIRWDRRNLIIALGLASPTSPT